jgi:hypothetical protein
MCRASSVRSAPSPFDERPCRWLTIAGLSEFFILSQSRKRPDRYVRDADAFRGHGGAALL